MLTAEIKIEIEQKMQELLAKENASTLSQSDFSFLQEILQGEDKELIEAYVNYIHHRPSVTFVHLASEVGSTDVVRLLLENGDDVNFTYHGVDTVVNDYDIAQYMYCKTFLLDHGRKYNVTNSDDTTPLSKAAAFGHTEIVTLLLDHGAKVNTMDQYGRTPLLNAAANGHSEIVKLLLEHAAEVNLVDKGDCTPLSNAAANGHIEIVKLLLDHGAKVNAMDQYGRTPLFNAATDGYIEIVKLLLEHGAQVNITDRKDITPLSNAAANGHIEIVKLLLEHGAEVNVTKGNTPLSNAAANGYIEIVHFLLAHAAEVNVVKSKNPCLHAAAKGHTEIVHLLLAYGADVNFTNRSDRTPLSEAVRRGHIEIVNQILFDPIFVGCTNVDFRRVSDIFTEDKTHQLTDHLKGKIFLDCEFPENFIVDESICTTIDEFKQNLTHLPLARLHALTVLMEDALERNLPETTLGKRLHDANCLPLVRSIMKQASLQELCFYKIGMQPDACIVQDTATETISYIPDELHNNLFCYPSFRLFTTREIKRNYDLTEQKASTEIRDEQHKSQQL